MNPGAVEEIGKAVNNVVDALRSQPTIIAILVFNIVILFFIFYSVHDRRQQDHEIMLRLSDERAQLTTLLAKCTMP